MKWPFVTRKRYDVLYETALQLCEDISKLEKENDTILGNAGRLADIEREDRKLERSHYEAVLSNCLKTLDPNIRG